MINIFKRKLPELNIEIINHIPEDDLNYMLNLIKKDSFRELEKLGSGAYSSVYGYKNYAIKVFKYEDEEEDSFNPECNDGEILKNLQSIKSVPKLYTIIKNKAIIVDKINGITVRDFIYKAREKKIDNFVHPAFNSIFEKTLRNIIKLGYKPYDLHNENVMIDFDSGLPIIVDVGLFSEITDYERHKFSDVNSLNLRKTYPTNDAIYSICDSMETYIEENLHKEAKEITDEYLGHLFKYPKVALQ